ncbi:MAG: gamma-glutamylcyclotransferase family protein [Cyanobacteria bacterium P01_H01_bin.21]
MNSSTGTIDVFVYGTLKPGGTYHQQFCLPYLRKAQPAQVRGLLYDLPNLGYPAMTLGDGWVKGYLFTLDEAAMPGLDHLEGYNPKANDNQEYARQWATVFDLIGQPIGEAWLYIMDELPTEAVWLSGGEWDSVRERI